MRILEAATAGQAFEIETLQRIVAGMAKSILSGDDLLVQALIDEDAVYDLSRHMANTAVFAIKIGHGAGCRTEELPWLGLAACLHDVGMTSVPKPILDKPGPLTADETALVRQHPEQGFRILQRLGAPFEWLANVALQEHEREDGSGYPKALREDEIHDYAKIVGLADAYESLTHFRPYRSKHSVFDSVKELITAQRTRFPDSALKGLIRGLSTFPVGSHVRLNSMEIARIVATNPASRFGQSSRSWPGPGESGSARRDGWTSPTIRSCTSRNHEDIPPRALLSPTDFFWPARQKAVAPRRPYSQRGLAFPLDLRRWSAKTGAIHFVRGRLGEWANGFANPFADSTDGALSRCDALLQSWARDCQSA